MKRLWLGVGLLALLLAASLVTQETMERIHSPIAENLEAASQAATAGDWEQAKRCYEAASAAWERYYCLTAVVADHSPMDELDMLFGELAIYSLEEEAPHFAATCASAAQMARAMAQAHRFAWWNLL